MESLSANYRNPQLHIIHISIIAMWSVCDLAHWLWQEFCVFVSEQTLSREVRAMFDYIEIFCTPTRKHVRSGMLSPAATD